MKRSSMIGPGLPANGEFVIHGAYVMTMDPDRGDSKADIHLKDGVIVDVGEKLTRSAAETIDARGMIALPGLIDTHWHMWNSALRGICGAPAHPGYFATKAAFAKLYAPEDMYWGVRLAAAEALHSGITTVHDWCHNIREPAYADADLKALTDTGVRARFSYGYFEGQPPDQPNNFEDLHRLRSEWFGAGDGARLLTLGMAARGVQCPPGVYLYEWEMARTFGLPITVHADSSRKRPPLHEIETMFIQGMLGKDVQVVHAVAASPRAIECLAETETSVSISPVTEMRIGYGFPPVSEMLTAGVSVGLSIDTTALSGNADMFGVMKVIQNIENARAEDEFKLPARRILELATIGGARALGMADRIGSITPGKRADIILVSAGHINTAPMIDPAYLLVDSAQPANVDTVIVDGRILKRRGQLTAVDVKQVIREANQSLKRLSVKLATGRET